eukprot:CAMPEP_0182907288 /NCGR_PEP_ID=MMETSP0034_2-20130328/34384_1 /TAXON_ID=156128 /ORGANISM="Nephroselmis pyriformis, Strain CCMP717" /LENGTH=400 /DNA_ID=CAMNT_0025043187 /DNA_START=123 /DNA_END=1324 /DNA_ORIENTATION=+
MGTMKVATIHPRKAALAKLTITNSAANSTIRPTFGLLGGGGCTSPPPTSPIAKALDGFENGDSGEHLNLNIEGILEHPPFSAVLTVPDGASFQSQAAVDVSHSTQGEHGRMDIEGHLSQWLAKELGEALASNLLVESAVNIYAAQLDDLAVESSICAVVSSLRGGRALLLLAQSPLRLLHSAPVLSAEATEDGGGEGAVSMHAMLLNKIHSLEVWCGEAEWGSLMAALALTAQESGEGGREEACYQRVTSHALAMRMAGLGKGGPPISPLAQVTAAVLNALHGGGGEAGAVSGEELEAVREGARYPRVREAIVDAALDAVLAASRGPGDDALDARVIRALSCAHQLTVVPAPWVAGAPGAAELAETLRDLSVRFSFVSAEYLLALASSLQELVVASERWH